MLGPRVMHASNLMLDAKRWVDEHLPYWRRKDGRDHIWLITHDEGPCYAPAEIRNSIILSHWGRTVRTPGLFCLSTADGA